MEHFVILITGTNQLKDSFQYVYTLSNRGDAKRTSLIEVSIPDPKDVCLKLFPKETNEIFMCPAWIPINDRNSNESGIEMPPHPFHYTPSLSLFRSIGNFQVNTSPDFFKAFLVRLFENAFSFSEAQVCNCSFYTVA